MLQSRGDDPGGEARFRVLLLEPKARQAALVDLLARNPFPIWIKIEELRTRMEAGALAEIDDPLLPTLRPDEALTAAELAEKSRRWRIIAPLVDSDRRFDLYKEDRRIKVAERVETLTGSDDKTYSRLRADKVISYLRLYWLYGQTPNALVPNLAGRGGRGSPRQASSDSPKRGRPRDFVKQHGIVGVNLTAAHEAAIRQAYRRHKPEGWTDRQIWQAALESTGEEVVIDGVHARMPLSVAEGFTLAQFRYSKDKQFDSAQRFRLEKGDTYFNQVARPKLGSTVDMASGPGSVYQIDATIGDIYLRSVANKEDSVGRPVLYLVLDMYSRMIVGYHVALHGPSWETARGALINAFADKVDYYMSIGEPLPPDLIPAKGRCRGLMGDRGWDHLCKAAGEAANQLGYKLSNLPPYRCDLKGLVEGAFDVANVEMIHKAPGAWRRRETGETPNKLDCAYTLAEFRRYLGIQIAKWNSTHVVSAPPPDWDASLGRAPTPVMLWNHGCNVSGAPDDVDEEWIRSMLLPQGRAHETRQGLKFRGAFFRPPDDRKDLIVRLAATAKGRQWRDVQVRWHEGTSDWILVPEGEGFVPYSRVDKDDAYVGLTFDEIDLERKFTNRDKLLQADARLRTGVFLDVRTRKLEAEARAAGLDGVRRTRRPKADKAARKAEVREGRAAAAEDVLAVHQTFAEQATTVSSVADNRQPATPPPSSAAPPEAGADRPGTENAVGDGATSRGAPAVPSFQAVLPGRLELLMARRSAAKNKSE